MTRTTAKSNRGGRRENAGMKPRYQDPVKLSVDLERTLLEELDRYRVANPVEMKAGGRSRRCPECPEGMQPAPRPQVVALALKQFLARERRKAAREALRNAEETQS